MKVDHIIWQQPSFSGKVTGLLDIEVSYHGGGSVNFLVTGTYDCDARTLKINKPLVFDDMGISGISLKRFGVLAEN